jgi:hypothetical protein
VPAELDCDLDRRRDDPIGWLNDALAASATEARAIGFELQIIDRPRVLEHVLLDTDWKLVLLHRANRLAQYVSERTAAHAGGDVSGDHLFAEATRLTFDRDDFLRYAERQALAYGLVRDLVRDPARLFVIEDGEVGTAAANSALLAFLEQEEMPLAAPDEHTDSPVIRERFADPEAVALALEQTVWRPWLDRDGG